MHSADENRPSPGRTSSLVKWKPMTSMRVFGILLAGPRALGRTGFAGLALLALVLAALEAPAVCAEESVRAEETEGTAEAFEDEAVLDAVEEDGPEKASGGEEGPVEDAEPTDAEPTNAEPANAGPANAGPANVALPPPPVVPANVTAVYKFTFLGLKLGEARLEVKVEENRRYQVQTSMNTGGLASVFFKSDYTVMGLGKIDDTGAILPSRYDSQFIGRDKKTLVSLIYDPDGLPMPAAVDPPYGERILKQPVSLEQKRNTVDPMGAWVHMMTGVSVIRDQPCGTSVPIFDGRRRYNFELKLLGEKRIKVGGGKIYKGKAYYCSFIYKPVAGYKESQLAEDAVPVPPMKVWIIPLKTPTGRTLLVPARVDAEAPVGTLRLRLLRAGFAPIEDRLLFAQAP